MSRDNEHGRPSCCGTSARWDASICRNCKVGTTRSIGRQGKPHCGDSTSRETHYPNSVGRYPIADGVGPDNAQSLLSICDCDGSCGFKPRCRLFVGLWRPHPIFQHESGDASGYQPLRDLGAIEVPGQRPERTPGSDDDGGAVGFAGGRPENAKRRDRHIRHDVHLSDGGKIRIQLRLLTRPILSPRGRTGPNPNNLNLLRDCRLDGAGCAGRHDESHCNRNGHPDSHRRKK